MFDWFRDMAREAAGIDSEAVKKEILAKKEIDKSKRYIFSKKAKIIIVALGLFYVVMSGTTINVLKDIEGTLLIIIKNIVMSILSILVIFALLFGKKKGEMVALIGIFLFVIGLFLSIVLI